MNKQQEIEQLAQAIYDSKIALDGSDYLFGIDGDDHFTKLAMHLVYGGYGNIEQAVMKFANAIIEKSQMLLQAYKKNGDVGVNELMPCIVDLKNVEAVLLRDIDETLKEFKNERTD